MFRTYLRTSIVSIGAAIVLAAMLGGASASANTSSVPIASGTYHTCALTPSAGVKCWGAGFGGELGNGVFGDQSSPVDVSGLSSGVEALAVGWYHACALTTSGVVKCWGDNTSGQLGTTLPDASNVPLTVSGLSGVVALAAGGFHTCALLSSGGVKCWGRNADGQLGIGTFLPTPTPTSVQGLPAAVTAIEAGYYHTCAITTAHQVLCWGDNFSGQLGDGTNSDRPTPVAVPGLAASDLALGESHTCALTTAGGAQCWGENGFGELGDGSFDESDTPVDVDGLNSGVTAISSHGLSTCAVTTGGGAMCWGDNFKGQLGNGTNSTNGRPVPVSGLSSGVIAIAEGYYHGCALLSGGTVKCWGWNTHGELGDGTNNASLVPVNVSGIFGPIDTTPPVISAPADITTEATSAAGATVSYSVTFSDPDDPVATSGCTPASGSVFPIGATTVTCSATDAHGNSSSAVFGVIVSDTTPPAFNNVPSDITVAADPTGHAVVDYTDPTATDVVDGSVSVTCVPPSGSTFALGSALITCSATDSRGNEADASFHVSVEAADLTVTAQGPAAVVAGDPAGFDLTVQVSNLGPMDNAGGFSVAGVGGTFAFDHGNGCTGTVGGFECSGASLAAGASASFTVHLLVAASAEPGDNGIVLTVFSTGTLDPNSANDTDFASIAVDASSDLEVSMTAPTTPQIAGDSAGFDYIITVRNDGPSDNFAYGLAGTLPAGFSFESGANCSSAIGGFTCDGGYADAGATRSFTVHVVTDIATPAGSHVASVTASSLFTPDPDPTNDTATASVTITTSADLEITISGPQFVDAGDLAHLVVSVTNHGPHPNIGGYTITGTITGGTFANGTGCTATPSSLLCIRGDLAIGATETFNLNIGTYPTAPGPQPPPAPIVTLTVASNGTPDYHLANDTAIFDVVPQFAADLGVSIAVPPTPQVPGDPDGFDIVVTVANHGPTDFIGTHLVIVSAPPGMLFFGQGTGCGASTVGFACDGGSIPAGSSAVYTLHTLITTLLQPGTTTLTATLTSTGTARDPNPGNQTASATIQVAAATADLAITLGRFPSPVAPGEAQEFTVTVENVGPWDQVGGFLVTGQLPPNLALQTFDPGCGGGPGGATGGFECVGPALTIGASHTFHLRALVTSEPAAPVSITASVTSSGTPDPNPQNDATSLQLDIVARASLALTMSAFPTTEVAGDPAGIEYTVHVENHGPSDNHGGFVVRGPVPLGMTFLAGAGCGTDAAGFFCTSSSDLLFSSHVDFRPRFLVDPSFTGSSVLLQASVSSLGTRDTNPTDNDAHAAVTVISRADLRADDLGSVPAPPIVLDATADPSRNTATFRLLLSNAGPSDARSVAVTPAGIDVDEWCLVTSSTDCTTPSQFSATPPAIGTLPPGAGRTLFLLVRAEPALRHGPLTWNGTFTVSTSTTDPTTGNDSKATAVVVNTVADAVTNLRAIPGNGNVVVSWAPPATTGGAPLNTTNPYVLTLASPGLPTRTIQVPATAAGPCLAPESTVCVDVTGLTNSRAWTANVVAVNRNGPSDAGIPVAAGGNIATPSTRSAARIVAPNATASLATCSTATPTVSVCISQFVVQKGNGGIVAIQAGVPLTPTFCNGNPCAGSVGALMFASSRGWTDITHPFTAVVNWDASLNPGASALYVQRGSATPAPLPQCMPSSKASPDPCLRSYQTLGGSPGSATRNDRSATILFTSAAGFVTMGQP